VLYFDIDNETPPYLSIDECKKKFAEFEWIISTSRSHQKEKHGIVADRFHIFFPVRTYITTVESMKLLLRTTVEHFSLSEYVDKNCVDAVRYFGPNPDAIVEYNAGRNILDVVRPAAIERKKNDIIEKRKREQKRQLIAWRNRKRSGTDEYGLDQYRRNWLMVRLDAAAKEGVFADYHDWLRLGAALKASGFEFDDWYALSDSDTDRSELEYKWEGFTTTHKGVTVGTLFYYAKLV
jgi:hypothetical protein